MKSPLYFESKVGLLVGNYLLRRDRNPVSGNDLCLIHEDLPGFGVDYYF